jgi:plasmid stabilization system protein ParE
MNDLSRIIIEPEARRNITAIHEWHKQELPNKANEWFNGILRAISTLERFPARCALAPEGKDLGRPVRQLLYGKRRQTYRILFAIREDEVHILAVRHSSRPPLTASREDTEEQD